MQADITTGELRLLAYLHDQAEGYTEHFQFDPRKVAAALSIDEAQMCKDASYLASHGLVGIEVLSMRTYKDPNGSALRGLWLTGLGENYMREVEAQVESKEPGRFKRIGLKSFEVGTDIIKGVAVKVLTELLTGHK